MGLWKSTRSVRLGVFVAVTWLGAVALGGPVLAADPRPFGDAKVLAQVPTPPGFPEGIAVAGNRVYVAGPATFGTIGKPPSKVLAYNATTGALVSSWSAKGENLLAEHANSSIALDSKGRIYVLNTQLGIYRLTPSTGAQEQYALPFPDLPPCLLAPPGTDCSPTLVDTPPLPNDLAFDNLGNAYVTDSMQATVWRVPAGGGKPEVWFQDARLASAYIGVNGIRLDPSRTKVYLTVSADLLAQAYVYTLPLTDAPSSGDLSVFHAYGPGDMPDGIAFGDSGLLYVAIATPGASGISALNPDGTEKFRLTNPVLTPTRPYDSPANIAFNGKGSILVTNHAFVTGILDPGQFSVLDVYVGDTGSPLVKP